MFNLLGYVAPFVMAGLLNVAFAAIGFAVILRNRAGTAPASRV